MALARKGQEIATPQDVLKEPLVLEFLDLGERPGWHECELESVLIDRLSEFLHPEFGVAGLRAGQTYAEAHQPRR
jgi:predicted nuclease of restriction endonuclease-like (RecB) superfamily